MNRIVLRTFVIAFWLVMTAWLIRYEAFPDFFNDTLEGYRGLVSADVLMEDSWMQILFNGAPIGYSHSRLEVKEGNAARRYEMGNRTELRLNLMGERRRLHVDTEIYLDVLHSLREFSFSLVSGTYQMRIKALRVKGNTFRVALRAGESVQHLNLEIPDDVILYSPMTETAMRKLKPGQKLVIRTLDPSSLSVVPLTIRALRKEAVTVGGKTHEATVLSSDYRGAEVLAWIGADGQMLREQTPFGWTLESCSAEEALAAVAGGGADEDLLRGLAVKSEGIIRDPEGTRGLRLRLTGVAFATNELASNRQIVEKAAGRSVDLLALPASIPAATNVARAPADYADYLKPSAYLQSDHPDMQARARAIVEDRTNLLARADAIFEWVYGHVSKQMTVSVPSALDVLRTLKGDCNEHTYLFVALARAAGVPAKIRVGLAYREGAFYYHAWPAVWAGDWVEMDPTWGERLADASHLGLVEGELASQMDLLKVMGQLKIKVVEEFKADAGKP